MNAFPFIRDRQLVLAVALIALLLVTSCSNKPRDQSAPQAGLVYDTLYREGEWVAAGKPIVALLPPQNIKVRAFVPETRVGSIQYGETVRATVDGVREAMFIAMKRYRQTLD